MSVSFRDALRQLNALPPQALEPVPPNKVPVNAMPVFWALLAEGCTTAQARDRLLSIRWS